MKEMFLYPDIRGVYPLSKYNDNILYTKPAKGSSTEYQVLYAKGKNISQTLPSFFISLKWPETNWAVSPADERWAERGELVFLHQHPEATGPKNHSIFTWWPESHEVTPVIRDVTLDANDFTQPSHRGEERARVISPLQTQTSQKHDEAAQRWKILPRSQHGRPVQRGPFVSFKTLVSGAVH